MVVPISNFAIDDDGIRCPENVIVDHFVIVKIPFNNPIDTVAPVDTIAVRIGAGHEIAKVIRTGMHVVDIRFRQAPRRSSRAGLRHHILLHRFFVRHGRVGIGKEQVSRRELRAARRYRSNQAADGYQANHISVQRVATLASYSHADAGTLPNL